MALSIDAADLKALDTVVRTFRLLSHDTEWEAAKYLLRQGANKKVANLSVRFGSQQKKVEYSLKNLAQLGMLCGESNRTYWFDQEMYAIFNPMVRDLGTPDALQAASNSSSLYVLLSLWAQRPSTNPKEMALAVEVKKLLGIDATMPTLASVSTSMGHAPSLITRLLGYVRKHQIVEMLIGGRKYCFGCDVHERDFYEHTYEEPRLPNAGPIVAEAAARYFLLLRQRAIDVPAS